MTTKSQAVARRLNSQKSTGPRTKEGRNAARRNSLRHGIMSTSLFLDGEDPKQFLALFEALTKDLQAEGALEMLLVQKVSAAFWRQRRLIQAECAMLTANTLRVSQEPVRQDHVEWCTAVLKERDGLPNIIDGFSLDELGDKAPLIIEQLIAEINDTVETNEGGDITSEAVLAAVDKEYGGLSQFVDLLEYYCRKTLEKAELSKLAGKLALLADRDRLETLMTYETRLDSQLFRTLKELRETQTFRKAAKAET